MTVTGTGFSIILKHLGHPDLLAEDGLHARYLLHHESFGSYALDFDVYSCREIESRERVHGLGRGLHYVNEPLMHSHLKLLSDILLSVGGSEDGIDASLGRKRDRA